MSLVNIGVSNDDQSYRYKMPMIQTKIEGRGNGIRTLIPNMVEIAKALHTSPAYTTKFFGVELGAMSKFDKTTERAIVNGAHTTDALFQLLEKFIEYYVLCPKCGLPETVMKVKKTSIKVDCAACGYNGLLQVNHKLNTYILNHPPNKSKTSKSKTEGKKSSKKSKPEGSKSSTRPTKTVEKKEEEIVWHTETSKEAVEQRKMEEFAAMGVTDIQSHVDNIMAQEKREDASPMEQIKSFIMDDSNTAPQIAAEIRRVELAHKLSVPDKLEMVFEAMLDGNHPSNIKKLIEKYSTTLALFTKDEGAEKLFVQSFEKFAGLDYPDLSPRMPLILQAFYECDVLSEEAIVAWFHSSPANSYLVDEDTAAELRSNAKVFVDWLETADEESD